MDWGSGGKGSHGTISTLSRTHDRRCFHGRIPWVKELKHDHERARQSPRTPGALFSTRRVLHPFSSFLTGEIDLTWGVLLVLGVDIVMDILYVVR